MHFDEQSSKNREDNVATGEQFGTRPEKRMDAEDPFMRRLENDIARINMRNPLHVERPCVPDSVMLVVMLVMLACFYATMVYIMFFM